MAQRQRAFNCVFYPESAPDDFREKISEWHVPALLILHDKDKEADGSDKKPHYHLLLTFSSLHSLSQVHELIDQLGSKTVQPSYDLKASARYLLHLDHPDKYQYPFSALESFSGAAALDMTAPIGDPSPEVVAWIREQGITEYFKLIDYCLDEKMEWYPWCRNHTMFLRGYLDSTRYFKRWSGEREK